MPRGRPGASSASASTMAGSKGHQRDRIITTRDHLRDASGEGEVAVEAALDLHHHGHAAADEVEEFSKCGDVVVAVPEGDGCQRGGRAGVDAPALAGEAVKREVVEHDGLAVGRELHIAFDGEAARDGSAGRAGRVLEHAVGDHVEPTMCHGLGGKPGGGGHVSILRRLRTWPRPRHRRRAEVRQRRP
jgi:hypothetical protein